jgi:hypothetical protein
LFRWLGENGRSYDPELLQLMQRAFDEAWAMHTLDDDPALKELREVLANAIVDVVDHGERNPVNIKAYALGQLLQKRNSSTPLGNIQSG